MSSNAEDDNVQQALAAMGAGPAARELYVDLLRPAAKELGSNLQTVARLITHALTPLHGLVWGLDAVRDWLSAALLKRLAHVKDAEIQEPPKFIAGQILLQLPFCAEEEQLRELYANLLASAMQASIASSVHPAYVQVIQQLSPDEARILNVLATWTKPLELAEWLDERGRIIFGSEYISHQFRRICERAGVANLDFSDGYLDNLLRLKILEEFQRTHGELDYANRWSDEQRVKNTNGRVVQMSTFGAGFLITAVVQQSGA